MPAVNIYRPFGRGRYPGEAALRISGDYERSSMIASLSYVDGNVVYLCPMPTKSQSGDGWLEFGAMLLGALGKSPRIRVPYAYEYFNAWSSGSTSRRGMFSLDGGRTWHYFDNSSVNAGGGYIEMWHNTPFAADAVIVSRSRQLSVHNCAIWLQELLDAYPGVIGPATSALAYTPGANLAGYAAQSCMAAEFSQQTQLYWQGTSSNTFTGRIVPPTPKYAAEINDTSLMPAGGAPKQLGVITAGTHAGEDLGDHSMMRTVEHLLGNSAEAQNVRRHYRIILYPSMNPPGRAGGHFRTQYQKSVYWPYQNDDVNRNFNNADAGFETNDIGRAVLAVDRGSEVPVWVMDFHGTYLSDGFSIVEDPGVTLHSTFRTRLAAECGFSIGDDANTPAASVTGYFRDIGTALYITHEMGDLTPKADSLYATHGRSIVRVISSMKTDGLIP